MENQVIKAMWNKICVMSNRFSYTFFCIIVPEDYMRRIWPVLLNFLFDPQTYLLTTDDKSVKFCEKGRSIPNTWNVLTTNILQKWIILMQILFKRTL